jgi:hypothetical protein
MNIKNQIKKTISGKSKKVYKLTSNNMSVAYFSSFIKIKSLFKHLNLIEDKLEAYCKIVRISKLYDRLHKKDLNVDEIIFLSKFYFKKTKRYYYFSAKGVLTIPDLRKFIDFYLNEAKLSIYKIFYNIYSANFVDAYKYLKSKNIVLSNKIKYKILECVIDSNNKHCNYYFFSNADFKEVLISYLHLNYGGFYYNLSLDNVLLYKNYYLLKLLKKAYEKKKGFELMNLEIPKKFNDPEKKVSTLKEIWNGIEINKVREMHLNNKLEEVTICKKCPFKDTYNWKKVH